MTDLSRAGVRFFKFLVVPELWLCSIARCCLTRPLRGMSIWCSTDGGDALATMTFVVLEDVNFLY